MLAGDKLLVAHVQQIPPTPLNILKKGKTTMITARQVPQLPGVVAMNCWNKAVGINVE